MVYFGSFPYSLLNQRVIANAGSSNRFPLYPAKPKLEHKSSCKALQNKKWAPRSASVRSLLAFLAQMVGEAPEHDLYMLYTFCSEAPSIQLPSVAWSPVVWLFLCPPQEPGFNPPIQTTNRGYLMVRIDMLRHWKARGNLWL